MWRWPSHVTEHLEAVHSSVGSGQGTWAIGWQPPKAHVLSVRGEFVKMKCIIEKSHAVFIVFGLLTNFLPIFTLLGPTAGPGSCLQKHYKDCCPF